MTAFLLDSFYETGSSTTFDSSNFSVERTKKYILKSNQLLNTALDPDQCIKDIRSALASFGFQIGNRYNNTKIGIELTGGGATQKDPQQTSGDDFTLLNGEPSVTAGEPTLVYKDGVMHITSINITPRTPNTDDPSYYFDVEVRLTNENAYDVYWDISTLSLVEDSESTGRGVRVTYTTEDTNFFINSFQDQSAGGVNTPIVNSAGEKFSDGVSVTIPTIITTIERIESAWDLDTNTYVPFAEPVEKFLYTKNSIAVKIYGKTYNPKTLLLRRYTAEELPIFGVRRVRYEFASISPTINNFYNILTPDEWAIRVVDAGSFYLDGGKKITFVDPSGKSKTASTGLLDGSGGKLPDGSEPEYITFDVFKETDFNELSIIEN